jgi:hypothetical protein
VGQAHREPCRHRVGAPAPWGRGSAHGGRRAAHARARARRGRYDPSLMFMAAYDWRLPFQVRAAAARAGARRPGVAPEYRAPLPRAAAGAAGPVLYAALLHDRGHGSRLGAQGGAAAPALAAEYAPRRALPLRRRARGASAQAVVVVHSMGGNVFFYFTRWATARTPAPWPPRCAHPRALAAAPPAPPCSRCLRDAPPPAAPTARCIAARTGWKSTSTASCQSRRRSSASRKASRPCSLARRRRSPLPPPLPGRVRAGRSGGAALSNEAPRQDTAEMGVLGSILDRHMSPWDRRKLFRSWGSTPVM